jgi:hypothetical protein
MMYLFAGSEVAASGWEPCRRALAGLGIASTAVSYDVSAWSQGYEAALADMESKVRPGVVLVGHSIAGLFLPVLGERIQAKAEIYLAAMVPLPQLSFTEQVFEDGAEPFTAEWSRHYGETASESQDLARSLLFSDCSPGSAFAYQRPPQDLSHLYDLSCPLVAMPPRVRTYLACSRDRTIAPDWQRHAAKKWLGVDAIDVDAGHLPQISTPQRLARLLADLLPEGKLGGR